MHGSDDDEIATLQREPPATVPDVGEAVTMAGPRSLGSLAPAGAGPVTPLELAADRARYALGELLGKGGMGEVRLAHDTRVDREVAVKLMRGSARTPEATARFLREARVQGRLDHPAVVPVHDLGVDEAGAPYFAMKRLTGTTLLDVLEAIGEDPEARARWPRRLLLDRLVDVCLAVEFAHARGVVHRDLKPANIMLGDYGEAYVLDWGIARIADDKPGIRVKDLVSLDTPDPAAAAAAGAGHTAAGALLGTPGYMAPEQMRGDAVDRRADVYALGCILFEILTLHPAIPHGEAAFGATLDAGAHHPRVRYPDADVPPELDDACARATAPDRMHRTGSARDLASAIRAYLDGDRDLARRRELALAHAEAGARALAAGDDGRADAMREAGRAIGLDPTCRPAQDLLSRLLLRPPETPLPEVQHAVERERVRAGRVQLRAAGRVYVSYLLFLPLLLALGVRDVWPMVVIASLVLLNFGLCEWAWRRDKSVGNLAFVALGVHGVLLATIGVMVGPFLITPALAISSVATFCSVPTFYKPAVVVLVHASACAVPFFLETVGVLPATFYFTDGGLVLDPWAIDLAPQAMVVLLVLLMFTQTASPAFIASRFRKAQEDSQEKLHLHHWHLRQLLPEQEAR
jgi:serine/threonine-protein kinase